MKKGELRYQGRRTNPTKFKAEGKDLRRLAGCCRDCGAILRGRAAIPAPDPYAYDVNNDPTPVVQCQACSTASGMEV